MSSTQTTVKALKAKGAYYEAGKLAAKLGQPDYYGCHFGMRSTLESARMAFHDGWNAARRQMLDDGKL